MIQSTRKALFLMTSQDNLTLRDGTRHKTGFYASEFVEPYETFKAAGLEVVVATPDGGVPQVDPASLTGPALQQQLDQAAELQHPERLDHVNAQEFALVFVPGGHAPMEELSANPEVTRLLGEAAGSGIPVAALCHGPAALLSGTSPAGEWLYAGRQLSGFSKSEEDLTPLAGRLQWELEDALRQRGGLYSQSAASQPFEGYTIQDGPLLTGENPASAVLLAHKAVQMVEGAAPEHSVSFSVHRDLAASADEVWAQVGRFDALSWHPGLASGSVSADGRQRTLVAAGGGPTFQEELLETGPGRLSYRMTGGLPVQPVGTFRVEALGAQRSRLVWEADIDTSQVDAATARAVTQGVTGFYEAGLQRLQERFGAPR